MPWNIESVTAELFNTAKMLWYLDWDQTPNFVFQGNVERLQFWSGVLTFKCIYSYFMHIILLESLVEFDAFFSLYILYILLLEEKLYSWTANYLGMMMYLFILQFDWLKENFMYSRHILKSPFSPLLLT